MEQDLNKAVHENVKAQIADKQRRNKEHIKLHLIWNTTQQIRKIQQELAHGYSFDYNALTTLVNTMFGFINSVAKPEGDVACEEVVEEIVE